jgi:hypothetical protein
VDLKDPETDGLHALFYKKMALSGWWYCISVFKAINDKVIPAECNEKNDVLIP